MQAIDYFLGVIFFGFPVAVLLALIVLWWLVTIEAVRPPARRRLGRHTGNLLLQISLFSGFAGLLVAGPVSMLATLLFPPFWLFALPRLLSFGQLLSQIALPTGLVVALVAAAMLPLRLIRVFTPIVALSAGLATAFVSAERVSVAAMCSAAAEFGESAVRRNRFFDSLSNAPAASQFFLHGYLDLDGKDYGWSYSEMQFYIIPRDTNFDAPRNLNSCNAP